MKTVAYSSELLLRIREVPSSILGTEASYSEAFMVFRSLQKNISALK
jgi:hypothetical protein